MEPVTIRRLSYPTDTSNFSYAENNYLNLQDRYNNKTDEDDSTDYFSLENSESRDEEIKCLSISDSESDLSFGRERNVDQQCKQMIWMSNISELVDYCQEDHLIPLGVDPESENKKNEYLKWSDFDVVSHKRIYWVNKYFIELLSLSLNIKAGMAGDQDLQHHSYLCEVMKSYLPKESIVAQYAEYLSYDNLFAGSLLKLIFRPKKPDLRQYLRLAGHYNEKALHLFDTFLHADHPNYEELLLNPVVNIESIKGAMGTFLRSESYLSPLRPKAYVDLPPDEAFIKLSLDEALVHRDLIDALNDIVSHSNVNKKFELYNELFIHKLARISTVYYLKDVPENLKIRFYNFYQIKCPQDIACQFRHNDPDFIYKTLKDKGCFSFIGQ